MRRVLRTGIVLGVVLAVFGSVGAWAQAPTDAFERATTQAAVPSDAHDRGATTLVVVPTDSHDRTLDQTPALVPADTSVWSVSFLEVALLAAIAVGIVAAGVLLAGAIRRRPPAGHPPLAHR